MTIHELYIQLDLQFENKTDILENIASRCNEGYLFVDSNNGCCYLFDENGNKDDIKKIKSIGNYAFERYESLKSIIIPDSIESIGNYAFEDCKNLESVIIPDSVESIEYGVFIGCKSLKSIIIFDSVKRIGNYAFERCESLKSVEIPDSVKSIGYGAFIYCRSLKSLIFKGKTIDQVKSMNNYPFGIKDESIIKCRSKN